jgi:glutaredoxin 3
MTHDVVMYRTRFCPYCLMAKRLLDRKGVPVREVDVSGDMERRSWLLQATGRRTVPQIFVGGRPIGGYDDLCRLERAGKLDRVLQGE